MSNTQINVRMDSGLKQQFETFCSDMGMTMSTAINIFIRQTVRENKIPFEISGDIPNSETLEAIEEVKKMKETKNFGKVYTNVDEMMKELLADNDV